MVKGAQDPVGRFSKDYATTQWRQQAFSIFFSDGDACESVVGQMEHNF